MLSIVVSSGLGNGAGASAGDEAMRQQGEVVQVTNDDGGFEECYHWECVPVEKRQGAILPKQPSESDQDYADALAEKCVKCNRRLWSDARG